MVYDLIVYTPMYVTAFWAIVLLALSARPNKPQKFLGIFMLLAFGVYLSHALYFNNQYQLYLYFDPVYTFTSLSVYPMYYWYIKRLTSEQETNYRNLIMFVPATVLALAGSITLLAMNSAERSDYIQDFLFQSRKDSGDDMLLLIQITIFVTSRIVFMIQVVIFLFLGKRLVLRHNARIANFYSNTENRKLDWVNVFLYSFLVTSMMSMVFNIIGRSVFNHSSVLLIIPSAIFSILLFTIGFQGHIQNYSAEEIDIAENVSPEVTLREYNQVLLREKLIWLFEEDKIFKQTDLKITQVALALQTNRTYVSNLINTEFKVTFCEFVNKYRVEEAKKMLSDTKQQQFTLDFIAESAGFGSVNSFIRIFKDFEQMTPGKFREKKILG